MNGFGPLFRLMAGRLKRHPIRFLLSTMGIAAGVALVFAVAALDEGLSSGLLQTERSIAGSAQFQVDGPAYVGLSADVVSRIRSLASVEAVAPLIDTPVGIRGVGGEADTTLVGVDAALGDLESELVTVGRRQLDLRAAGLYLPEATARRIGARRGDPIAVAYAGETSTTRLAATIPGDLSDKLDGANLVFAPIAVAQRLTKSQGRVSRLLVKVKRGTDAWSRRQIRRVSGPAATVYAIGEEPELLAGASALQRQSAGLFSTVALIVGALLAYNATLLNLLERRREFAIMRMIGAGSAVLVSGLLTEAAILASAGIGLGLVIGSLMTSVLTVKSDYLSAAFPIIPSHSTSGRPLAMACGAGLLAVAGGGLLPALALLRVSPVAAIGPQHEAQTPNARAIAIGPWLAGGVGMALAGSAIVLLIPGAGIAGVIAFILGAIMLVRWLVPAVLAVGQRILPRPARVIRLAASELFAMPKRATAGAAIGAVSILALTLVGGLVRNMEDGTLRLLETSLQQGELWVIPREGQNVFLTEPFSVRWTHRLAALPGIERALPYRSGFLDWSGRRLLVFGLPAQADALGDRELIEGDPRRIAAELARGDVVMTQSLARSHNLHIGDRLFLPTPRGTVQVRLAGTTTNYGWGPGAIGMDADSFAYLWRNDSVTAVELSVKPGVILARARTAVAGALAGSTLKAITRSERRDEVQTSVRAGTAQLRQIALLVLLAGALGISAAMLAAVLPRKRRLATMRVLGMSRHQAFGALLTETGMMVAMGAFVGLVAGILAQALSAHWIAYSSGYPVEFALSPDVLLEAAGLTAGAVLLAAAWPAIRGARIPGSAAFSDDQ
jgi:putative ABC transport system permease protein